MAPGLVAVGAPTLRAIRATTPTPPTPRLAIAHRSRTTVMAGEPVFLEALVNEVFQDASDEQRNRLGALDDLTMARMGGYWLAGEQRSMLAKYQAGLTFAKVAEFETGANPYQDVSLLTKARNALVHFRPETVAEDDIMELQSKFAGKFDDNALLAGTGNPWFHSKMLGAGFVLWATVVSGTFADAWITKMGLPGTFRADLKSFPAP